MVLEITPKNKKKPFKVNYDGVIYKLSGKVPLALITAQNDVPRPKVMAGKQKEAYESQVGIALLSTFLEAVVPDDFREVLDFEDIAEVFTAWQEYTGWGKEKNSES